MVNDPPVSTAIELICAPTALSQTVPVEARPFTEAMCVVRRSCPRVLAGQ
jgi:hypothetical protein